MLSFNVPDSLSSVSTEGPAAYQLSEDATSWSTADMHNGVTVRGRAVVTRKAQHWKCTKCRKGSSDCGHVDSLLDHLRQHGALESEDEEGEDEKSGEEKEREPRSDLRRRKFNMLSLSSGTAHPPTRDITLTTVYRATSSITCPLGKWDQCLGAHTRTHSPRM